MNNTNNLEIKHTSRGFPYTEFKDYNGRECSVQKSSIATEDCIWLGADKIELKEFANGQWVNREEFDETTSRYISNNRMHLTQEQVAELIPILQLFVETGEIE